ncbi:MAG: inorganic phosphate transporter [Clostridiales bacterium]|jgi:PiT family inorganic phosphate transporter|nr:inorganic phosphate transporter [Clostridiales bacterium]
MFFSVLIILITLGYTVFVGYNDGANAIATSIATRAMPRKTAVIVTVVFTIVAPLGYYLLGMDFSVASTIGKTVNHSDLAAKQDVIACAFLFTGVLGGLLWCLFSAKKRLPVSTSHSLMGGISGAATAAFGFLPVDWRSLFIKIILTSVAVPLASFVVGFFIMKLAKRLAYKIPVSSDGIIKKLQVLNVGILASAISINNVQKPLGVAFLLFVIFGRADRLTDAPTIIAITALSALALVAGACFGGTRIIHTVGKRIYKIKPFHSFLTQISVESVIFAASSVGIPVSAGQAVSSAVMGIGASSRFGGVNWSNSSRIFIFWILTYPITFAIGALFFYITRIFVG